LVGRGHPWNGRIYLGTVTRVPSDCEEGIVRIERETAGDVTILAFAGEFDAANVPSTIKETDGLIEGSLRLVFNFRKLTFIDSSGLGYLLKTMKVLGGQDGDLVFSEPAKCFRNIVDVYGLGHVFKIFASDRAALDHFGE
jgi:anti-sigma B factor antagonist